MDTLASLAEHIRQTLVAQADWPSEMKESQRVLEVAQKQLDAFRAQPTEAVKAYNAAVREMVIQAALQQALGYCSQGKHLAPLAELEGLIVEGAYVSSGYYESLHGYEHRRTICLQHRHGLRGSSTGRYEGEYEHYHTFELKDPTLSLSELDTRHKLQTAAQQLGLELPPEATLLSFPTRVQIGDLKIID